MNECVPLNMALDKVAALDPSLNNFKVRSLALSILSALSLIGAPPAHAGWARTLSRSMLPSLVRTVVREEFNDLRSGRTENFRGPGNKPVYPAYAPPVDPAYVPVRKTFLSFERGLPSYQWTARPAMDYLDESDSVIPIKLSPPKPLTRPRDSAPAVLSAPLVPQSEVSRAFQNGTAGDLNYDQLVASKVFVSDPLRGSIFKRKSQVKYIILHSTETAFPADAHRVILSWNNRGLRHPGSQFVVDRDGTICSTVDPDRVTVHVDTNRTLPGYSNDNSIGIEIVRSGKQQYTQSQLDSVTRLVSYLQSHYGIADSDVTTHHHVQPSDRSDPVNFDFLAFDSAKSELRNLASLKQPAKVLTVLPKPAPDFRRQEISRYQLE